MANEFEIKNKCSAHDSWFCDCPIVAPLIDKLIFAQRVQLSRQYKTDFSKGFYAKRAQEQADYIFAEYGENVWNEVGDLIDQLKVIQRD